jgi:hypothetical protein
MTVAVGLDVHVDINGGKGFGPHSWHRTGRTTG